MPEVALLVNGKAYAGWTRVRITRSMETIAGSFDLSVSERWAGQDTAWPIREEDECVVSIDGVPVITGYVDTRTQAFDATSHSFTVAGRDRAGALVDSSAVLKRWEFSRIGVLELCQELAAPFGVTFSLQEGVQDKAISTSPQSAAVKKHGPHGGAPASVGSAGKSSALKIGSPVVKLAVNPGDSPFEVIDRACRQVGFLPVSDGSGGVVLTRASAQLASSSLVEGDNILAAEITHDATKRYRKYVVAGQQAGSADVSGRAAAGVGGTAQDLYVRRAERVLVIRPEGVITPAFAVSRAAWEATVRRARGQALSVTVQGWQQADRTLWPVNALALVHSALLGISARRLITEVTYALSVEEGSTTVLKLVPEDAFAPEAVIQKAATDSGGSGFSLPDRYK